MIQNAFLIGCDGQRHDFAAPRLGELRVDVNESLEIRDAVGGAGGDHRRGGKLARFAARFAAEDVVVQDGGRFEPNAAAREFEQSRMSMTAEVVVETLGCGSKYKVIHADRGA